MILTSGKRVDNQVTRLDSLWVYWTTLLSEVSEEDVAKNESDDELEGLAALFLEHERKPAVRIRGYVEEVVANLSDDRFKP